MKSTLKILLVSALSLIILAGCSNSGSTRESYFGYNNNPKYEEESTNFTTEKVETQWVNPLGSNKSQVTSYEDVVYQTNGLRYQEPMYIPVIVPWWSSYYGWMSPYNHRRFYFNSYYDNYGYCGYDWYSPWYAYHPYYGGYYYDWFRPDRSWYGYNSYTNNRERPSKKESYRNFGASRGTYSNAGRGSAVSNSPRGSVVNTSNSNRTVNSVRANDDNRKVSTTPSRNLNTDSPRGRSYVAPEAEKVNNSNIRPSGNDTPSRQADDNRGGAVRGSDNRNSDSPRNSNSPSYSPPPSRNSEPSNSRPSNDSGRSSGKSENSNSGSSTNSPRRTR